LQVWMIKSSMEDASRSTSLMHEGLEVEAEAVVDIVGVVDMVVHKEDTAASKEDMAASKGDMEVNKGDMEANKGDMEANKGDMAVSKEGMEGMAVNKEGMVNKQGMAVNKVDMVVSKEDMALQVTAAAGEALAGIAAVNTRRRHMMEQPLSWVVRSQGQRRAKTEGRLWTNSKSSCYKA